MSENDEIRMLPMRAWRLDDGALYTIAARTMREAVEVYWKHTFDIDGTEMDDLTVKAMSDADARACRIDLDEEDADGKRMEATAYDLAQQATEPTLLGCSEY